MNRKSNNKNRMNKKNDFIEKLYQKRVKLSKIQLINKFSFDSSECLESLKGLTSNYP